MDKKNERNEKWEIGFVFLREIRESLKLLIIATLINQPSVVLQQQARIVIFFLFFSANLFSCQDPNKYIPLIYCTCKSFN